MKYLSEGQGPRGPHPASTGRWSLGESGVTLRLVKPQTRPLQRSRPARAVVSRCDVQPRSTGIRAASRGHSPTMGGWNKHKLVALTALADLGKCMKIGSRGHLRGFRNDVSLSSTRYTNPGKRDGGPALRIPHRGVREPALPWENLVF